MCSADGIAQMHTADELSIVISMCVKRYPIGDNGGLETF